MFEVPNLDDFSMLPSDFREAARVLKILSQYCEDKAESMSARLSGQIDKALLNEGINERRYRSLPQWAKW